MSDFLARITRPYVQQFIRDEERADVRELVLRHKEILGLPSSWIATQIAGRRKAKDKLPLWFKTPGIVYPSALNLEQCSSEATARFKQNLLSGRCVADLTAGFGVDTFFLCSNAEVADSVEPDETLSLISAHNHALLSATNIRYHCKTAENFLSTNQNADAFYVDPSRRTNSRKVIRLADSNPNVVSLQTVLLKFSPEVLVKAAPLLDLKQAFRELPSIEEFIVLAVENEVKELLLLLRRTRGHDEPVIRAVNLDTRGTATPLTFTWGKEKTASVPTGEPMAYLYEPNAAILKAGAFKLIGQEHNLIKLSADTHLYTSDKLHRDFPGRVFEVIRPLTLNRDLKKTFEDGKANILVRNFPQTVEEIKRGTGLLEGGTDYLICTRSKKPVALLARRLP